MVLVWRGEETGLGLLLVSSRERGRERGGGEGREGGRERETDRDRQREVQYSNLLLTTEVEIILATETDECGQLDGNDTVLTRLTNLLLSKI